MTSQVCHLGSASGVSAKWCPWTFEEDFHTCSAACRLLAGTVRAVKLATGASGVLYASYAERPCSTPSQSQCCCASSRVGNVQVRTQAHLLSIGVATRADNVKADTVSSTGALFQLYVTHIAKQQLPLRHLAAPGAASTVTASLFWQYTQHIANRQLPLPPFAPSCCPGCDSTLV